MAFLEQVRVECHSGYRANERPVAVWWRGKRLTIAAVEKMSRSQGVLPEGRIGHHFRVRLLDGHCAELVYDEATDVWWWKKDGPAE